MITTETQAEFNARMAQGYADRDARWAASNTDGAWPQINARLSDVEEVRVDGDGTRHFRFPDDPDGPVWLSAGCFAQHLNYLAKESSR